MGASSIVIQVIPVTKFLTESKWIINSYSALKLSECTFSYDKNIEQKGGTPSWIFP